MAEFALRELIDEKRLQHLQNEFCKVTGVTAVCVDKEGRAITEPYIDKSLIRPDGEDPILGEYRKKAAQALDRVQEGSLEEQVVEELPDGGHVAAVAVSVENQIILYWQVYDLKKLDAISFYQILDLLRDTSADIYRDRMSCFSAEAESRRSRYAEEEMSRNLHTIEATTEIVQLLDSDEQIELTMSRWLKILAQHIQVDSAEIFQLQADTDTMNVVCEWLAPGLISYFDKTSGIPEKSFLHTEKPLVVSTDSVGKPDSEEIEKIGMKAVMIFPILKQESGNMVLSLNHRRQGHVWSMAEIKFTSDAVKILQSILTRRIQKNSLAGSYAALEEILDNVGCAIYVTDQNTGRMLFANQILKNTFAKELMDHNFDALLQSSIHKDKTRTVSVVYHAEKETWYDLLCKEIAWVDGKKANLYSLYDITDKKLYQRRIEQQAYTDFLTGLYNRMCCERDLARQIDQAKKTGGKGALLYLDLDDFKHINDGLGHQYGDVLLQEIAYSLQETDGIKNSCYRMGGDEFVIIVKPWYFDKITEIVDKISKRFNDIWHIMDVDYYCTMSMGIAVFPDQGKTVDELIKKADFAMYEAKKGGKNRFLWYTVEDEERKCADNGFRDSIKELVGDDCRDFDINYQPVFDKDGILYGAEALVRINSGSLGRLLPAEFLPTAEYLGIMNRIGHYVFAKAVKTLKKWNGTHPDLKMFINMAPTQLMMPKAAENIMNIIKQWEVNPENIYCDISEKTEFLDEKMALATLEILNGHGINISLDDFGSGKMSLGFLKDSHASMIKFDNSLVKKSRTDDVEITILRSITEIADILDIDIAFVGIEDDNDNNMALENKADYLGGFYYGEALPEDEFETKWLK